ncbi:hypothetical protein FPQ18DRAFT_56613 [Pyronema domesticum]|nr:hypothetical protein FPQ18DRAFT_56613 [Pyronema domesticum]
MEYLNVHDESFSRPQSSAANSWRGSYASSSGESYTEIQLLPISSGRSDDHRSSEDSHGESHSSSSDTGTEHHHIEPIVKDKERVPEGEAQDHEEHHHECECGHDHDGDDEHDNDHDHDHIDKEDELQEVPTGFFGKIEKFWCNNVTIIVPGATARDHLALERTYLSYHRTSLVLSLISVIIAQLQVLQKSPAHDTRFGFHVLGKPLAVTLVLCSMLTSLIGVIRWWHWQQTLLRGKAICGGWELSVVGLLGFTLLVTVFGLVLAVGIKKTIEDVPELKN